MSRKREASSVTSRRARIYDAIALLTAIIVISLDQWTKTLVASNLGPPDLGPQVPLIGPYLTLYYIRNQGAAFNMFDTNGPVLVVLIAVAVAVIGYLYLRMLNTGTWLYKLIFGLIIGGAAGNLLDRFRMARSSTLSGFVSPRLVSTLLSSTSPTRRSV